MSEEGIGNTGNRKEEKREQRASRLGSQHLPLAVLEPHLRQILKIIIKNHSNLVDVGICTEIPNLEVGQEKQVWIFFTEQEKNVRASQ